MTMLDNLKAIKQEIYKKYSNPRMINSVAFNNHAMGELWDAVKDNQLGRKLFSANFSEYGLYTKFELINQINTSNLTNTHTKITQYTIHLIKRSPSLFFSNAMMQTIIGKKKRSVYPDDINELDCNTLKDFVNEIIEDLE